MNTIPTMDSGTQKSWFKIFLTWVDVGTAQHWANIESAAQFNYLFIKNIITWHCLAMYLLRAIFFLPQPLFPPDYFSPPSGEMDDMKLHPLWANIHTGRVTSVSFYTQNTNQTCHTNRKFPIEGTNLETSQISGELTGTHVGEKDSSMFWQIRACPDNGGVCVCACTSHNAIWANAVTRPI